MSGDPLLGTWRLVSWTAAYGDGRPAGHPYGMEPKGLLLCTGDGYLAMQVARPARRPLSGPSPHRSPMAERAGAFDGFYAYAGRYKLFPAGPACEVEVALDPALVGTVQLRTMRIVAGRLVLMVEEAESDDGIVRRHALTWRRPG